MINQQLFDYVRQQLATGTAKDGIKNTLIAQGWAEQDISDAFASTTRFTSAPVVQPSVPTVQIKEMIVSKGKWSLVGGIIVVIALLVGAGYYFLIPAYSISGQTNKDFLNTLNGEVVYLHIDGNDSNIYKISATGDNKVLLYKNSSPSPLISNRAALKPTWTNGGLKISFAAMSGEFWSRYSMNADGSNVTLEENYDRNSIDKFLETFGRASLSKTDDIKVENGSIYIVDSNGTCSLVYKHNNYDAKFNAGASEASWGPDSKYVMFMLNEHGSNEIMIASRDGTQLAKLADGRDPDWKYSTNTSSTSANIPTSSLIFTNKFVTVTSPLSVTIPSNNEFAPYSLSGTSSLIGTTLDIAKDGGINFLSAVVQPDGTWSTASSGSWWELYPGHTYSVTIDRRWDPSIYPRRDTVASFTITVTQAKSVTCGGFQ